MSKMIAPRLLIAVVAVIGFIFGALVGMGYMGKLVTKGDVPLNAGYYVCEKRK